LQSRDAALGIDGKIVGRVVRTIGGSEPPEFEGLTDLVQDNVRCQGT
jgi:hypothetical protein